MTYDQQSFGVLFKKRIIAVIFLGLLGFGFSQPAEPVQSQAWKSKLISMLGKSNKLYSEGKGDLSLSTDLLRTTAFNGATDYYRQANLFYFFSLKKSSFDENPDALEKEARQIIPLLDDPEKKKWEALIQNKDDALVPEINQFWQSSDPVVSTTFNERLFEHWFRIAYAQKHFTNNTNSPYGTDDRGTIFVRFGPPDLNIHKSYSPKQVVVPAI